MRPTAAAVLGVALAVGLAGVIVRPGSTNRALRGELTAWVEGTLGERRVIRPTSEITEPDHPGSAFAGYADAVEALQALGPGIDEEAKRLLLEPLEARAPQPDGRFETSLTALAAGARRSDATYPLDLSKSLDGQVANLLAWRTLTNVAGAEARRRAAHGDADGAVTLGLDALTMATDVLRAPLLIQQMIGCALVAIVTDQVFDDEMLTRIDGVARLRLARGLATLEESVPAWCDGRAEALVLGHQALGPDGSTELIATAHALALLWDRVAASPAAGWTARRQQFDTLRQAYPDEPLASVAGIAQNCEQMVRQAVARLRLLRLAVAAPTEPLILADPLGDGPICMTRTDDEQLTFRAGSDGEAKHLTRRLGPR